MSDLKTLLELLGVNPKVAPLTFTLIAMLVGNFFGVWVWGRHVKVIEARAERLLALAEAMAAVMESAGLKLPNQQPGRIIRSEQDRSRK